MHKILIVDDEKTTRDSLRMALAADYDVRTAASADDALAALAESPADLVLTDNRMPGHDGLWLIEQITANYPATMCIMLTAYGSVATAVEAMKLGAVDFRTKPVNLDDLDSVIAKHLAERRPAVRVVEAAPAATATPAPKKTAPASPAATAPIDGMVGSAPAMQRLYALVRKAAPSAASVLLQGPSGAGKEVVAHAIHKLSPRFDKPFVAVHCAAITSTLLESELFGHEEGAFTGADKQHIGYFERANGGTLFLDEIGEIDPATQVKLLRFLESHEFQRVGGTETIKTDVRVVAATNKDLRKLATEGEFREDLYYRLAVIPLSLPALAEHAEDIPALANHLLKEALEKSGRPADTLTGFAPATLDALRAYPWPGNVRELRNCVEQMAVFADGPEMQPEDIPANIRAALDELPAPAAPQQTAPAPATPISLEEQEKQTILAALAKFNGNKSKAADHLGINRKTIQRKLDKWGL